MQWDGTYYGEIHDLQDPDGQRKVDQDKDHQEQDEEVEASLPPAVDAHLVQARFLGALHVIPVRALLLAHLEQTGKAGVRSGDRNMPHTGRMTSDAGI